MVKNILRAISLMLFSLCIIESNYAQTPAQPLTFAMIDQGCDQSQTEYADACTKSQKQWQTFGEILSKKIQQPIEMRYYHTPNGVIPTLINGQVDVAYVKQMTYRGLMQQNKNQCFRAIAQVKGDGRSYVDRSIFITNVDKKNVKLEDLVGKRIGLIQESVSGQLIPTNALKKRGLFHRNTIITFSTYYDAYYALASRKIDGLFASQVTFNSQHFQKIFDRRFKNQFSLASEYPSPIIIANCDKLNTETLRKLADALESIKLDIYNVHGFRPCPVNSTADNNKCLLHFE